MKNSPLAGSSNPTSVLAADPYLALNDRKQLLSEAIGALPVDDETPATPEQIDNLAAAMRATAEALAAVAAVQGQKPSPVGAIRLPEIKFPEMPKPPTEWDVEVVERDDDGRVKRVKIKAPSSNSN